jgi:hypothetical protein
MMPEIERFEIFVIGSGEAGKHLPDQIFFFSKLPKPNFGAAGLWYNLGTIIKFRAQKSPSGVA